MWRGGVFLVAAAASCTALHWIGPDEAAPGEAAPGEAAPEEGVDVGLCRKGLLEYEAVNGDQCKLYCLPPGECEAKAKSQGLSAFGITGPGNCKDGGFIHPAELDGDSQRQTRYFRTLGGPCGGMALGGLFSRREQPASSPPAKPPKMPWKPQWPWLNNGEGKNAEGNSARQASAALCDASQDSFTAIHGTSPGVCLLYCIPPGECEALSRAGAGTMLTYHGRPGACHKLGYTKLLPSNALGTSETSDVYQGPCTGMRFFSFVKPAPSEMNQGS